MCVEGGVSGQASLSVDEWSACWLMIGRAGTGLVHAASCALSAIRDAHAALEAPLGVQCALRA